MGFYHINAVGRVVPCTSPDNCPFGVYGSKKEAKAANDQRMSDIALASSPETSISNLSLLAENSDYLVRFYVAENKNTPPKVLEKLARDNYRKIRVSVAENKNTPVHVLEELAKDNNILVLLYIASNENTPLSTIYELYKNNNKVRNEPYVIKNLTNKLMRDSTKIENIEELLSYASEDNRVFSTIDDFYEAYDLTYGEDGLINPMIAVEIYTVEES